MSSLGISADSPVGVPNSSWRKMIAPWSREGQSSGPESSGPHVPGRVSALMSLLGSLAGRKKKSQLPPPQVLSLVS
jgi:hypothetical protein